MGHIWEFWCRLCGSKNGDHVNMFIRQEPPSMYLPAIIQKHLMITVRENDEMPSVVCWECLKLCVQFKEFYERTDFVDQMYHELRLNVVENTDYDPDNIRSRYCLDNTCFAKTNNVITPTQDVKEEIVEVFGTKGQNMDALKLVKRKQERPKKVKTDNLNINNSTQGGLLLSEEHVSVEINFKSDDLSNVKDVYPDSRNKKKKSPRKRIPPQVHRCRFCNFIFATKYRLKKHKNELHPEHKLQPQKKDPNASRERSFICEECGKAFFSRALLITHQIMHSNEYPFHCTFCDRSFKRASQLKHHEDTHNETSYICPHCGLTLNTKRTLKMHLVVHSDQKLFKCQHCSKEYKRSKSLKAHLILHTGMRPYSCPWCDKTFANGSNCRKHKRLSHPAELAELDDAGEVVTNIQIPKLEYLQSY